MNLYDYNPNEVLKHRSMCGIRRKWKLTPTADMLLEVIYEKCYHDYPNPYYASNKELSEELNKNLTTISKGIKDLKSKGLIFIIKSKREDGGNDTNGYKINYNFICDDQDLEEVIKKIHKNKGVKR